MSGTINVSRDLWDDTAFRDEPFSQREAWIWMIAEASWKPRERRSGRRVVTLQRGQLAHSVRFMAERWNWSKSRVQRFLDMLENRDMIRNETGTLGQTITICKYDDYQNAPNGGGTVAGHEAGQQRDSSGTNQNKGEIRGKEKKEDTDVSSTDAPPHANEISEAVSLFNEAAGRAGWSQVQRMNPNRSKQLRSRLNECGGLEGWEAALAKASASDINCGRTPKPWNGFAFDWLIKSTNFTKLMEGNYDNREPARAYQHGGGSEHRSGTSDAFAAVAARLAAGGGQGHG